MAYPGYPTDQQVEAATHEELGYWARFLPSPMSEHELKVINRIAERFKEMGGFTPELSKKVGW